MDNVIKNSVELATTPLRRNAVAIAESGLRAIDTEVVLRESVIVTDTTLHIKEHSFSFTEYRNIYIIGFGKASCTAAWTLEKILGTKLKSGAVIGVTNVTCEIVDTYIGTHPVPSHVNFNATQHIEEIAHRAKEDDLVIVVVSGGGSALLCSSFNECEQGAKLYEAFLHCGGTIDELNTVRKHISHLKGGGLARTLYPATVVGLIFSDVVGGDATAVASGPTYLDTTTVADAQAIIERYNLGSFYLNETPRDPKFFERVYNIELLSNQRALQAMCATATALGYQPKILSTTSYNTPEEIIELVQSHASPGTMYCLGGEVKMTVPHNCTGKGGRNDHVSLAVLPTLNEDQVFVSLATDGHDNTDAAGSLIDTTTLQRARKEDISIQEHLVAYDSYPFFKAVGGHLKTGLLESNVADLTFWITEKNNKATPNTQNIITAIEGSVVADSRGLSTISITVTAGGKQGMFMVPSGASTGSREVIALPATEALEQLQTVVAPALIGFDVTDQAGIDACLRQLDTTEQFTKIGGNTALGISVAVLKVAAQVQNIEPWQWIAELFTESPQALAPRLFVNLINGGQHAPFGSCLQEYQIIPDTDDVAVAYHGVVAVMQALEDIITKAYLPTEYAEGDEGGWALRSNDIELPLQLLEQAIKKADQPITFSLGLDCAASSFYDSDLGMYKIAADTISELDLMQRYAKLQELFPTLRYVEDPFNENSIDDFVTYLSTFPTVTVIGDDLTTTNDAQLKTAIEKSAISGIIIKPNQIGTVTDTLATMARAYRHGISCIVSHRSGETMDDFIADLAFGTKCFGFKAGAPRAPVRDIKYQRLLTIFNT